MAIFYFILIRPQLKRQKQHQGMLSSLQKGDKVITSGGIHGTIVGLKDDVVVVKVAENTKLEISKSAVAGVVNKGGGTSGGGDREDDSQHDGDTPQAKDIGRSEVVT